MSMNGLVGEGNRAIGRRTIADRIGRTGRAGANGISISFACEDDAFLLPQLEKAIGMKLDCVYPPEELLSEQPMEAPRQDAADQPG